jgi:hypothetical protein
MIAILVYFVLCALGVFILWTSLSKEEKKNDGIRKDKLSELYQKIKAASIPNVEQSDTGTIFIEDFAIKCVYLITYHPHSEEYVLFAYKPSDNANKKTKDYETKLITKNINEILWYLEVKFDF